MECWHTQLRLVEKYFPEAKIKVRRGYANPTRGAVFAYVSPAPRDQQCPINVIETMVALGYAIVHIQEPRE